MVALSLRVLRILDDSVVIVGCLLNGRLSKFPFEILGDFVENLPKIGAVVGVVVGMLRNGSVVVFKVVVGFSVLVSKFLVDVLKDFAGNLLKIGVVDGVGVVVGEVVGVTVLVVGFKTNEELVSLRG